MHGLGHILPRSLTQALVPALTHTMTHSPLQDYYCYYCYHHQVYCSYCHYAPSQLYYAQYYASYYSQYYANYYEDAFGHWLTSNSERRSDLSWKFEIVDKILSEKDSWGNTVPS